MNIFGKMICGALGFSLGGPIGLLIGVWLGHKFDRGLNQDFGHFFQNSDPAIIQALFFESTFAVMGHVVKADGVVKQEEIEAAEQIMLKLGLTGEKRAQAISAFNKGKSPGFNLDTQLKELIFNCARKPSLIQMFLEIQIVAAVADGQVSAPEMEILYQIGNAFRISTRKMDSLIDMVQAQQAFHQGSSSGPSLEQAYKVLGVNESTSKQEVKRAYRKLMSQHHPDKLVSKGMPEEMIKVATEKSQEIQSAYNMLKKHMEI